MNVKNVLEYCDSGHAYVRPRYYADANAHKPQESWDYDSYSVKWGEQDDYNVMRKIGRGKYCEAFEGFHKNGKHVVIKLLKPVKKRKIRRELKILQNLAGGPNIIQLLDHVKDPECHTPSFVFEYINNVDFKDLYPTFDDYDVRFYTYKLLQALDHCHRNGIVHRDVKPQNIMIDPAKKVLKLIDWGLAEFYHLHTPMNVRVASRYYKGPELLVEYELYDYSLDMWSYGCILAGMIFQREPLFRGADNADQLVRITKVLGTESLFLYLARYNIQLEPDLQRLIEKCPKRALTRYVTADNDHLVDSDALDMLEKTLLYDHSQRMLPIECFSHPYYKAFLDGKIEESDH